MSDRERLVEALHKAFHDAWPGPSEPLDLYADSPIWQAQADALAQMLAEARAEALRPIAAVVARMEKRPVDHRHDEEVGHWGVAGRAYFYAGEIYDDYADLRAALAAAAPDAGERDA